MTKVWILMLNVPYESGIGPWIFSGDDTGHAAAKGTIEAYKRDACFLHDAYFTLELEEVHREIYNDIF
jgi:hypothetical protein